MKLIIAAVALLATFTVAQECLDQGGEKTPMNVPNPSFELKSWLNGVSQSLASG